jgi:drug/metabolite transporter (DMT)-like permease
MDKRTKSQMPVLLVAGIAMVIMATLSARLTHSIPNFYFALGFLLVVVSVWLWKRRSPDV